MCIRDRQYCVQQLCTVQCTHIWTDLTVLWIGFCLTGPISLWLDSLHFTWVVDDTKCIVVTRVCVSVCLCVCVCPRPHAYTIARGCPLVVHYWADLQSGYRLRCYGNITRTRNVSEYMLVLALYLVFVIGNPFRLSMLKNRAYVWCTRLIIKTIASNVCISLLQPRFL